MINAYLHTVRTARIPMLPLLLSIVVILVISSLNFPAYAQGSQEPSKEITITEVELNSVNGTQWIEVYNPTTHEISLATMHINGSDGHQFQILAGLGGILPQRYQLVELQRSDNRLWSASNNTITIYQTDPDLAARGIENVTLWDRTPPLADAFSDSKTWQLNGTKWIFAEATPMRAIPEFPVGVSLMFGAAIAVIIITRKQSKALFSL